MLGTFILVGGRALTAFITFEWKLIMAMGILGADGAGAEHFSMAGTTFRTIPLASLLTGRGLPIAVTFLSTFFFTLMLLQFT